ncbi:MAG: helix-turn-helix domain-containing protein [Candidatus Aenigmatarchaeota archaeon]|nr:hypothetical protein [Candidatus Aenigmarchaeota archaeon]
MIANNQILDALKQIGLNLYERKIWVALLSRGNSTAGELSKLSKVPHSRTYDILESLADKGFVIIQNGRPARFVAVEPFEALERAKKKIQNDAEIAIERIANLQKSNILKELQKIYKEGLSVVHPAEISGMLHGRDALHRQIDTAIKNAKKHISIITTNEGLAEIISKHKHSLRQAALRGVKLRIAAPKAKDFSEELKEIAELRNLTSDIEGRFALIDDTHVLMLLTNEKETHPSQEIAFWSQSEHAASKLFKPMFENIWKELK